MLNYIKLLVLGVVAVFALIAANYARDVAYMVHAIIIFLVAAGLFLWTLRRTDEPVPARVLETSYMDGVVRYGVIATAFWGVVGFAAGTFIAAQLAFPALPADRGDRLQGARAAGHELDGDEPEMEFLVKQSLD